MFQEHIKWHLNSQSENKVYDVFRKKFHIPTAWINNETFKNLVEHRYMTKEAQNTFIYIEESLRSLGYIDDNESIVRDYLHFMVMDLLRSENIAFITEDEIRNCERIHQFFGELTPDLIVKSDEHRKRKKPMILDIYIGKSEVKINEKKSKYKQMGIIFDVHGLTMTNYQSLLKKLLPQDKVDYLYQQVQIFLTEHHYWRACLKLKKMLFNDTENAPIQQFHFPEEFEDNKKDFFDAIKDTAEFLLIGRGL